MAVTAGVISRAHSWRTLFGSSSGPAALSTLMLLSNLNTPSSSINSVGISSSTLDETLGGSWSVALVNTDWNWSISNSARPLESLTS